MKRRPLLAVTGSLLLAGCTAVLDSEVELDTAVDTAAEPPHIEFLDGSSTVGQVGVSPTETAAEDEYVFGLLPELQEGYRWEFLQLDFSFPELDSEWPFLYLRADRPIDTATVDRDRDGTTKFSLSDESDQYPAPQFVVTPKHEDYEALEMEVVIQLSAVENGFAETTYEGSDTLRVELY